MRISRETLRFSQSFVLVGAGPGRMCRTTVADPVAKVFPMFWHGHRRHEAVFWLKNEDFQGKYFEDRDSEIPNQSLE